jgi:hydroxymethylbilane synthase
LPDCEIVENIIRTRGDDDRDSPLPEIGGAGLFTEALERALLDGTADLAVHSLKDLPIEQRPGLDIGAIGLREDPRDVLVSSSSVSLAELKRGARVGTSSHRRASQVLAIRPDLDVQPIRGNVETRIAKVDNGEYDAVVLAAAGVLRLGLGARVGEWLPLETFLPAPGQGALAVQCRVGDVPTVLVALDEPATRACTAVERRFLALLGGGCSLPVGGYASITTGIMHVQGFVGSRTGEPVIRVEESTDPADGLQAARRLADQVLARGGAALLAE